MTSKKQFEKNRMLRQSLAQSNIANHEDVLTFKLQNTELAWL